MKMKESVVIYSEVNIGVEGIITYSNEDVLKGV